MTYFRKRQRQLGLLTISLLIGGWISVICQNCLAHTGQIDVSAEEPKYSHCESDETVDLDRHNQDSAGAEACLDDCDCDNIISSLNTAPQFGITSEIEIDLPVSEYFDVTTLIVSAKNPYDLNYSPPDCAQLTPISQYCVQIK
jgi:hypothetical protein